jgi:regulator of sigma E protease
VAILPILFFIFTVSLLILIHEAGHFFAAKLSRVKVLEFGLGFPPRIISWVRRGTKYSVNSIFLGGFVKLFGEEGERGRGSFSSATLSKRFVIVLAGVAMNLLLSLAVLAFGFSIGMTPLVSDPESLGGVTDQKLIIAEVLPGSPAEGIGLKQGDLLSGFGSSEEFQEFTKSHKGEVAQLIMDRPGEAGRNIEVTLADSDPALGVAVIPTAKVKLPIHKAFVAAIKEIGAATVALVSAVGRFVSGLVVEQKLSAEVIGPVGIALITPRVLQFGLDGILNFIASLSLSLAILNALPFPALDGGRVLFLLFEGIFGKRILKAKFEGLIHAIGFALLIALLVALTYRDILRAL